MSAALATMMSCGFAGPNPEFAGVSAFSGASLKLAHLVQALIHRLDKIRRLSKNRAHLFVAKTSSIGNISGMKWRAIK